MLNKIKEALEELGYTVQEILEATNVLHVDTVYDEEFEAQVSTISDTFGFKYDIEYARCEPTQYVYMKSLEHLRTGCFISFEEDKKETKTFGDLKAGDIFYELNGCGFSHHIITKAETESDLTTIFYNNVLGNQVEIDALSVMGSDFPFYASLEKLEQDLKGSLNFVKWSKEEAAC